MPCLPHTYTPQHLQANPVIHRHAPPSPQRKTNTRRGPSRFSQMGRPRPCPSPTASWRHSRCPALSPARRLPIGPNGAAPSDSPPLSQQWQSRGLAPGGKSRQRAGGKAMRCRLWLGLAWLLLARAPGAARTSSGPRRPRSYPHLEGDVRWRRLFSSTHFFLRVDPSGLVQGTRWCHSPDSESRGAAG